MADLRARVTLKRAITALAIWGINDPHPIKARTLEGIVTPHPKENEVKLLAVTAYVHNPDGTTSQHGIGSLIQSYEDLADAARDKDGKYDYKAIQAACWELDNRTPAEFYIPNANIDALEYV